MAKPKAKVQQKPKYTYPISDVEANYRIMANPDPEKFAAIKAKVTANGGYCPSKNDVIEDNRCICKKFLERDSEGWCKCRLYYKEARTKKEAEKYKNTELSFNEKKEKEIEKEADKEMANLNNE